MAYLITFPEICIFLATLAICGYMYLSWKIKYFERIGVKSLPAYPIVGSLGPVVFRKRAFSEHIGYMYNQIGDQRFGGIFEFFKPVVLLKDPELIKLVTVKDFDHFVDRHMPLTEESDDMFGKSVFSLEGDRWRHMRAAMSPAFTGSKMRSMFVFVNECGRQLSNFLNRRCREHQAKTSKILVVEMKDLWSRYANDVIARAGFGVQVDSLRDPDNEIYAVGKTLTNFGGAQFLIFLGYQFSSKLMKLLHVPVLPWKVTRFLRDLVEQAITVREREDIVRPDLIQLLMKRRGSDTQQPRKGLGAEDAPPELNNEDIAAQVMVFFLAGFETTSTLLSFMSNRLAVMPDIQQRLHAEIDEMLARHGGRVTYEAVSEMKYLEMVVNETLRMYPPVEVLDRKCVMRYVVPATSRNPELVLERGDAIWVPVYGLHRDPRFWPDPQRFDPERFSDANKHNITPFTFLPFGAGPRNCIGTRFSMMKVKIAVIHLLSHFELIPVERTPLELRLSTNTFNITVDGGFWLGIQPRRANISNNSNNGNSKSGTSTSAAADTSGVKNFQTTSTDTSVKGETSTGGISTSGASSSDIFSLKTPSTSAFKIGTNAKTSPISPSYTCSSISDTSNNCTCPKDTFRIGTSSNATSSTCTSKGGSPCRSSSKSNPSNLTSNLNTASNTTANISHVMPSS